MDQGRDIGYPSENDSERERDQAPAGGNGTAPTSIRRLVHVAPFWARWSHLDDACAGYQALVTRLSETAPGGRAHFVHDDVRESSDRQLDDKLAAAGEDRRHLYPVWHWLTEEVADRPSGWIDARDVAAHTTACQLVEDGLARCRELHSRLTPDRHELLVDQLNLFSVRFFFDHTRFDRFLCDARAPEALAPDHPQSGKVPPPYFVCLDLRFDVKIDTYWTFATLSLWSDWPHHRHIAPVPDPEHLAAPIAPTAAGEELEALRSRFEDVTRCFEWFIHGPDAVGGPPRADTEPGHLSWSRPRLEVFDVGYRSPRFWFAVAADRPKSLLGYWTDDARYGPLLGEVADQFLEVADPRADTIAAALVEGEYLVQRRFIHDHHGTTSVGDEPTYLLLPRDGVPVEQEERGYRIVRSLLELEWYAATVLYDVDSDLEVARTHVAMYERNARQAGVLLDALVLHLPGTSGNGLRIVHESIELVHQTLLQGVADLANMTTIIQESLRKVGDGAGELVARFDRELDQQSIDGRLGIRASLAEQGLFERLRDRARDDVALAERVQTRYESLLQEITMAFEERRVREADKLERYSGGIALIFGVVGIVTALEATLTFRWDEAPGPVLWATGVGVGIVAAVLFVVIMYGLSRYRRVGKLGTKRFRRRYQDTWSFLAMTSTDSLYRMKAYIDAQDDEAERTRLWNEADARFSTDLAAQWDSPPKSSRPPDGRRRWRPWTALRSWMARKPWTERKRSAEPAPNPFLPKGRLKREKEVRRLAKRVESFVCETLLVSERTPNLYDFALPRLTCMYRLLSTTRDQPHTSTDTKLVSDFDVRTALVEAGVPEDRWETFLDWERELLAVEWEVARLANGAVRPGEAPVPLDACELLSRLEATGLEHGLSNEAAASLVTVMWTNIQDWRPPVFGADR